MAIQQTIKNYLDAVEKKFGIEARKNTELQHRGGSTFNAQTGGCEASSGD